MKSVHKCIMMFDKKEARKLAKRRLADLPEEYIDSSNNGIKEAVIALPEYTEAECIFAYYSVGREVDTHGIIDDALSRGKTVALPVVYDEGIMEYAVIENIANDLVSGQLSIPEPSKDAPKIKPQEGDFLLVPALRFDKHGHRLGYGGGYYDRFLAANPVFSVGLCREKMIIDDLPLEEHDMSTICLVTEKKTTRLH